SRRAWQEISITHVGVAEDPRFLANVKESAGIERVGIRSSYISVRCMRVLAKIKNLAHRPSSALHASYIGRDPAGHFDCGQRVAVDVGIGCKPKILGPFDRMKQRSAEFGAGSGETDPGKDRPKSGPKSGATGNLHDDLSELGSEIQGKSLIDAYE